MLLGSEEGGVEPKDYPLILDTCQSRSSVEAQERRHPELCLVDRVLPSSTYTLKDKASPQGSTEADARAWHDVIACVSVRARRRRRPRDALT
jgi:hypothetical protein